MAITSDYTSYNISIASIMHNVHQSHHTPSHRKEGSGDTASNRTVAELTSGVLRFARLLEKCCPWLALFHAQEPWNKESLLQSHMTVM